MKEKGGQDQRVPPGRTHLPPDSWLRDNVGVTPGLWPKLALGKPGPAELARETSEGKNSSPRLRSDLSRA